MLLKKLFIAAVSALVPLSLVAPVYAQEAVPLAEDLVAAEAAGDLFAEEGLTDVDLEVDLEAEVLPADGVRYQWESIVDRLQRVFTFNAEKKAELDRQWLQRFDRKLAACAELGNEECVEKVQERIQARTEIAQRHLEKYQGQRQEQLEKFQAWRESREELYQERQERAQELKGRAQELRESWQQKVKDARERRKEILTDRQEKLKELRENRRDARQGIQGEFREGLQDAGEQRREQLQQRKEGLQDLRNAVPSAAESVE